MSVKGTEAERFCKHLLLDGRSVDVVVALREAARHSDGPRLGATDSGEEYAQWPDGSALVSTGDGWRVERAWIA